MKIILSGPDGSGKSSLVNGLREHFTALGPVRVSWRRFGFVFARVFNLFARRIGWSYYEQTPTGKIGYHDYKLPWSLIYIALSWIDCMVFIIPQWWWRDMRHASGVIIIDRFLFDIVADVILSTRNRRVTLCFFDALLRRHNARNKCIFLVCAAATVHARRPDVAFDNSYPDKIRIYSLLRRLYRIPSVHTDRLLPAESVARVVQLCAS